MRDARVIHTAYLSLGGNMGDKRAYIERALGMLSEGAADVARASAYYRTRPVGFLEQDDFLNIACEIRTGHDPMELLALCGRIEDALGRRRAVINGPRTIDLDILLYEGVTLNTERLTIPHPRMTGRGFVIIPLFEIAPDIVINGTHIREIYGALDKSGVEKLT